MQVTANTAAAKGFCQKPKTYKRFIWWYDSGIKSNILQIYNKGMEYSLVSDDYSQCHGFVWCKDFLHDVIYSCLHNMPINIYNFQYNPAYNPNFCQKETRILVANAKDPKFRQKIHASLEFVNQLEERLKIPLSKIRECSNPLENYKKNGVFLWQGHKRWQCSPPMLSLYTLLIRVGCAHMQGTNYSTTINALKQGFLKPYQTKDSKWISSIEPAIYKLMRHSDKKLFYRDMKLNYPKNIKLEMVHNRLGILSFAEDMTLKAVGGQPIVPYWHRFK